MKKFLSLVLMFFCAWIAKAQSPVFNLTHIVALDTTFAVAEPPNQGVAYNLLGTVSDDKLFYTSSFTYAARVNDYQGTLYALNLKTFEQQSFVLMFPDNIQSWQKRAASSALQSISVLNDDLLMTICQRLIWYKKKNGVYELRRTEVLPNVMQAYLHGRKTYALVEDFYRSSLTWLRFENEKDTKGTVLRKWKYKCSFLTQFQPNKYLQIDEDNVFFMPPGERYILKFTPAGELVDSISFDFPEWNDFPRDLIDAANACPYGAERIYKALNMGMKNYTFARAFDVLSDSLVFVTMNMCNDRYNPKILVMRLLRHNAKWSMDFVNMGGGDTSKVYDDTFFPMYYYGSQEHLLSCSYNGKLLQLLHLPENDEFKGLNVGRYRRQVLDSYKYADPVLKLRVLSSKDEMLFYNYDNQLIGFDDFANDKVLMLVNVQPQCSACQKHLLRYFSTLDSTKVSFTMLYTPTDNYLDRRNLRKSIANTCQLTYTDLYMINGTDYGELLSKKTYPAVLLWERGKGVVGLYDTSTIFTDDLNKYEYTDEFREAMRVFLE